MVVLVVTPSTPDRRRQVAEAVLQIIASRGTDAGAVDGLALHAVSAPGGLDADQLERALGVAVDAALRPTGVKRVRKRAEKR